MSDSIRFDVSDRKLEISIHMPSLPTGSNSTNFITIDLTDGQIPKARLTVLQEIQSKLSYIFIFEGGKTLDQIVKEMITTIGTQNMTSNVSNDNFARIKERAKLYYRMWDNKEKSGLSSTDDTNEYRQNASIVIDILSWWFIRRLLHVYVVCAILQKIQKTPTPPQTTFYTSHAPTSYTPYTPYVYPSSSSSSSSSSSPIEPQPLVVYTKDPEFETLKQKYNKNVSNLESDKTQLQNDIKVLIDKHSQLELDNQQLQANNEYLAQRLEDFKQLLVHSTSMMFKLDEVPNIIMK